MAKKPVLDILPRNLEFHNLSHVFLNATQSRTLGLGLKFRPSLRPPATRVFKEQIQDFCRSVRLHYKYADHPTTLILTPNCMLNQIGIRHGKTQTSRKACIMCVKSYWKTSARTHHCGKAI